MKWFFIMISRIRVYTKESKRITFNYIITSLRNQLLLIIRIRWSSTKWAIGSYKYSVILSSNTMRIDLLWCHRRIFLRGYFFFSQEDLTVSCTGSLPQKKSLSGPGIFHPVLLSRHTFKKMLTHIDMATTEKGKACRLTWPPRISLQLPNFILD